MTRALADESKQRLPNARRCSLDARRHRVCVFNTWRSAAFDSTRPLLVSLPNNRAWDRPSVSSVSSVSSSAAPLRKRAAGCWLLAVGSKNKMAVMGERVTQSACPTPHRRLFPSKSHPNRFPTTINTNTTTPDARMWKNQGGKSVGLLPGRESLGPLFLMSTTPIFLFILWYTMYELNGDVGELIGNFKAEGWSYLGEIVPTPFDPTAWQVILSYMAVELAFMRCVVGRRSA